MPLPVKVLYIIDALGSGGKERQLVELLSALSDTANIHFELVLLSHHIFYSRIKELNIKTHVLIRRVKKDPSIFKHLCEICRQFRPDIIHSWDPMSSFYAVPVTKMFGIKFVNGMIRQSPQELKALTKLWVAAKCSFPFSDLIVSNSHAGIKAFKAPAHKSVCIHNGFDLRRVEKLESKETIRKMFHIGTEKVVGMVASFNYKKDYATYISAAQMILESRDDVTFLCVGDGVRLESIRKLVRPFSTERIKFLGRQTAVESIVNVFDIGVLSTFSEGISNCIMEYMALGKPSIATDGGGTAELLLDGVTGFLVKSCDAEDLRKKIETLLQATDLAHRMGITARERIQRSFSLQKMRESFVDVYSKLMPS